MNHTARPLRINVGFLVNQPPGFQREVLVEFDTYKFEDDFEVNDLHGMITLARTQNGVRVLADLAANIPMECGRCLEPFTQELHSEFEEIFTFAHRPLSEDEAIIPEDGNLDFDPIIREYMLLEVPYTPVCKPDCKGLCAICGQNLNNSICEHVEKAAESSGDSSAVKGPHPSR